MPDRALRCRSVSLARPAGNPFARDGGCLSGSYSLHRCGAGMTLEAYRVALEPFYQPLGDEIEMFRPPSERIPVMLKGPPVRQDAFRRVHGLAARQARWSRWLPRGFDRERSRRPLSARRRGHRWIDGPLTRAVARRHLLSRRNRRGAQRHHGHHPSADRCAPHPAAGEAGRDRGRTPIPARHLLQSRLPERAEGPQAIDQAALHRDRLRLSAAAVETEIVRPGVRRRRSAVRRLVRIGDARATFRVTAWTKVHRPAC